MSLQHYGIELRGRKKDVVANRPQDGCHQPTTQDDGEEQQQTCRVPSALVGDPYEILRHLVSKEKMKAIAP